MGHTPAACINQRQHSIRESISPSIGYTVVSSCPPPLVMARPTYRQKAERGTTPVCSRPTHPSAPAWLNLLMILQLKNTYPSHNAAQQCENHQTAARTLLCGGRSHVSSAQHKKTAVSGFLAPQYSRSLAAVPLVASFRQMAISVDGAPLCAYRTHTSALCVL